MWRTLRRLLNAVEAGVRTQVAIIGAGPTGLMLGRLLDLAGIDNAIVERRSREHVLGRIRAGILEQTTVDLLRRAESAQRLDREGIAHDAVNLAFDGLKKCIPAPGWACCRTRRRCLAKWSTPTTSAVSPSVRCAPGRAAATTFSALSTTRLSSGATTHFGTNCAAACPRIWPSAWSPGRVSKSIAALRSFVAEPMRFGRLVLAGDAAHIVPPTGAKGLNLAASDIHYLSEAIPGFLLDGDDAALTEYSRRALDRVWKSERFSWWFTRLTHRFDGDPFEQRMKVAELNYLIDSETGRRMVAENYVGLPL